MSPHFVNGILSSIKVVEILTRRHHESVKYCCLHCPTDINECENRTLNSCDGNATCVDRPGNYTCRCQAGYAGSGFLTHNGGQLMAGCQSKITRANFWKCLCKLFMIQRHRIIISDYWINGSWRIMFHPYTEPRCLNFCLWDFCVIQATPSTLIFDTVVKPRFDISNGFTRYCIAVCDEQIRMHCSSYPTTMHTFHAQVQELHRKRKEYPGQIILILCQERMTFPAYQWKYLPCSRMYRTFDLLVKTTVLRKRWLMLF